MKPYNFGAGKPTYKFDLKQFKGVDFSTSATNINFSRTPDSVNMISSVDGFPVKRTGYKKIINIENTNINGIHKLIIGTTEKLLVHAGTKLYDWDKTLNTYTEIHTGMNDTKSISFQFDNKLYILDGLTYIAYGIWDTEYEIKEVADIAYAPTTFISRTPYPEYSAGTRLEYTNMLGGQQINTFSGTGQVEPVYTHYYCYYYLSETDLTSIDEIKVFYNGVWETMTKNNNDSFYSTNFLANYNLTLGRVAFEKTNSVDVPPVPTVDGVDNVSITFTKTNQIYLDTINKCTIFDIFTYNLGNYIFLSGNDDVKNYDYRSEINNPTYFPDINYTNVGQSNTAIMTYIKLYGSQMIIKEENEQDYTIYTRNFANGTFTLSQGIAWQRCISKYATKSLRDDPLFLSKDGVISLATKDITGERYAQNRSYYINSKLTKEANLDNAISTKFNGYYILCVNGNCYVCDSRQKVIEKNSNSESFQYEWYFWNNIYANCFFEDDDTLYFGTDDGDIMRFCTETETDAFLDNETEVKCYWVSPIMTFNNITNYKSLKGLWVMVNPYNRSGIDIYYRVKSIDKLVKSKNVDIFNFNDINFERFSFDTDYLSPHIIPTNTKSKKFMTIQFLYKNEKAEPFGLFEVQGEYTINGKFKG